MSSTRLDISDREINRVCDVFAHAGLNLVRLEAIDNRNCILGSVSATGSRRLDRHYLDRLDFWIEALRLRGIYYYLDLLDFRTFKADDGVAMADSLRRGARPYAMFDPRLIELQKEYADELLLHRNRYSGLRPVDDPALAMVEICNEQGFFLYPDRLDNIVEPYRTTLRKLWNAWLRNKYHGRDALEAAWRPADGSPGLGPDEDPDQDSVRLPYLSYHTEATPAPGAPQADPRLTPARVDDGVEFLADVQHDYCGAMIDHLRSIHLNVPITAVVSSDVIPDVASVADVCDFTAENWYADGGYDDARYPGERFYSNRNPLEDDSTGGLAPFTAALRWNNKPVVVREFGDPWPNQYRAASVPEALAYASLQDLDAVLLFGYQTNRALNGAEPDALNELSFQSDPTVWGLYALAGQAFLRGLIRPAVNTLTLVYPPGRLYAWPNRLTALTRAAWSVRLDSVSAGGGSQDELTPSGDPDKDLSALRALLDRLGKRGAPLSAKTLAASRWRSDTGEITLYFGQGLLQVQTPQTRIVAGKFAPGRVYDLGDGYHFSTQTTFGALMMISLDGRALAESGDYVVKMVTRAVNTDEELEGAQPDAPAPWALRAPGSAPVLTEGRTSGIPTRVWRTPPSRKGKPAAQQHNIATLYLQDGTWELDSHSGGVELLCDTPGIQVMLSDRAVTTVGHSVGRAAAKPGSPGDRSKLTGR